MHTLDPHQTQVQRTGSIMQTLKLYKIILKNKEGLQNQEREARSQGRIG